MKRYWVQALSSQRSDGWLEAGVPASGVNPPLLLLELRLRQQVLLLRRCQQLEPSLLRLQLCQSFGLRGMHVPSC
jgi:hypothetical protein